ncbi:ATP-grasp domain-containing protein [Streptomyces albipurpureus]|uniref:ATP-grasp domain-containing protein n=1 Tax=Streptomyces albipurpureus TaxID=2897419 RepID=A0ABT0UJ48_9ACTN|nr:ATP-grasp domain-containing protein [Streptomyces sp. CWNU-1]MCM2388366.1 ATP-grasp domain-containing protein [Streptomyces sp. CWNU-1]
MTQARSSHGDAGSSLTAPRPEAVGNPPGGVVRSPAVIVDPYSSGTYFAPAFHSAGIPTVAVLSRSEVLETYAGTWRPEDFDEVIHYQGDLPDLVARLRALDPQCVIAGSDPGVELADLLAAQVVPRKANVPALTSARRDKGAMARAVAAAGLPTIAQICTDRAEDVAAWIAREGLAGRDLVIKPPRSASTDGVMRLARGTGWREAFGAQLGYPNQWGVVNDQMLVMEYVTGTEFVVDTFSCDGRHTVTDVTRYSKVDNGVHMAVYDSMEWLAPDDPVVPGLVDYTAGVLDAVGMRFGAAHVEIMLTDAGPRLIELNARPHGGGQPPFCRHATGDSQIDRTVRAVREKGADGIPAGYALLRHMLVVFLISRSAGVVRNAEVFDAVETLPSLHHAAVQVRNGQHIGVTQDLLNTLSLGFIVLAHEDREQLWADYKAVRRLEEQLRLDAPV